MFEPSIDEMAEMQEIEKALVLRDQWGDEMTFDTDSRYYVLRSFALEFENSFASEEEALKEAQKRSSRDGNAFVVVEAQQVVMPQHQVEIVNLKLTENKDDNN